MSLYRYLFSALILIVCPAGVSAQDAVNPQDFGVFETDLLSPEFHKGRRDELRKQLPANSVAVIFSAPLQKRSNDIYYAYHQRRDLYYLTGCREPHSALIISNKPFVFDGRETTELLVVQPLNPAHEIWDGKRLGPAGATTLLKLNAAVDGITFCDKELDLSLFDRILVSYPEEQPLDDPNYRGDLASIIQHFKLKTSALEAKMNTTDAATLIGKMRSLKTPEELVLIRKACNITCQAQNELMRAVFPGMTEYQAQAIVQFQFAWMGSEHPGFPSICGSGANSCILHYNTNRKVMESGDMLLVDIGAEYHGYTADITRTFPVSGTFTDAQRELYNLVLLAQEAGIEACRPGAKFWDPHTASFNVIADGLLKLGIITHRKDAVKYFMHGTSHYMGLDVHDTGTFEPLQANQVVTVEPGIYIPEGSPCDPKWWNTGIRIEDDILITRTGQEILSGSAPKTIEAIERLMQESPELLKISEN
jgi:Xaa-Pro aminopeptidase